MSSHKSREECACDPPIKPRSIPCLKMGTGNEKSYIEHYNCKKTTTAKHKNWDFTLSDTTAAKPTVIYVSCLDAHHPWSQWRIIVAIGLQRYTAVFFRIEQKILSTIKRKYKGVEQRNWFTIYNLIFRLFPVFKSLYRKWWKNCNFHYFL